MNERCPQCEAIVDDTGVPPGGHLRCGRCSTRFIKARVRAGAVAEPVRWKATDQSAVLARELDVHPALLRRRPPEEQPHKAGPPASPWNDARESPSHADLADTLPGDVTPEGGENGARGTPEVAPPRAPPARGGPAPHSGTTNPGRPGRRSLEEAPSSSRVAPAARKPVAVPQPQSRTQQQPPVDIPPVIPGYEVTELVGRGAMGRVYRARQTASGRWSAIKLLAPELAVREDFIQRFEREGAAMRAVNHPGVVAVMDGGAARQPDGTTAHYLCMEFVEGPPLRRHLDKGALPPDQAIRCARLIIQALGAAHAKGIIHRDLKPENILAPTAREGEERLVIVDFGLAGILDEENDPHPNLTKSRMTMGTVNYMAPEQRTDAKRVDQRADLYAAGVIFYELLTGDLPLGRFALPTERGVPVPASVDRCLVRSLARNADERYQTAAHFDEDLRAIEAELRRSAGQHTVIGRARPAPGSPETNAAAGGPAGDHKLRRSMLEQLDGGALAGVTGPGAVTAWLTAAPWVRRAPLLWAAALLVAGAGLAIASKVLGLLS